MRFGIMAGQGGASWREIADMWRFLDRETRYHSAWMFDHFITGDGSRPEESGGICFEGWSSLAAVAAITERIRMGVLVTGVTYRNPAILAKMAVTVDHVSNGRLYLGIGAAWHEVEHRMYGISFPPVRERAERLEEAVELIRRLFETSGPVSYAGKHYTLNEAIFEPKPVQRPLPILVGGGGEKRTLRTAARFGDAINVAGTPDIVRHKIEVLERHCRDAGRDPADIEKTYWGPIIVSDNEALLSRVASGYAAMGMSAEDARRLMPIGGAEHVRSVVEQYAQAGITQMIMMSQAPWKRELYQRINDEVVEAFA